MLTAEIIMLNERIRKIYMSENLTDIKQIKFLLEKHGFNFSKSLGQNFLINSRIPKRIAAEGTSGKGLAVEIGPGIGCLTRELAQRCPKVTAYEIDKALIPILEETVLADFDNVEIINEDFLKADLETLKKYSGIEVCANLPYYITSPVIMRLLESGLDISSITVMIQKEVAKRLCAAAGSKEYGGISAAVQYYSRPKILFDVSAGNFIPAPKVTSSVVRLDIEERKNKPKDESLMFRIIKAGFSQRRKTLTNALSSMMNLPKEDTVGILSSMGLKEDIRAEKLGIDDFIILSDKISEYKKI